MIIKIEKIAHRLIVLALVGILIVWMLPAEPVSSWVGVTATVGTSITCDFPLTDTNATTSFATLTTSAVATSTPNATNTVSSNIAMQITVYDVGAEAGKPGLFCSGCSGTADEKTIGSANASYGDTQTLSASNEGYGIQATTTGTDLNINARFLQTGTTVGGLETSATDLASSTGAVDPSELMTMTHKAAISGTNLAGAYTDTITYTCSTY